MTDDPELRELYDAPWRFEFPQAMRILLRNSGHGAALRTEHRRYDAAHEPVRIGAHQWLGFPASDIQSLELPTDKETVDRRPQMLVNYLGLTGPSGVLPQVYTEFMMQESSEDRNAPAAFFDIFNHRFGMLFFFAWEKYRFSVSRERRADDDFFRQMLLSLAGLGTEYLQRRQFTSDDIFAKYTGLLAMQPRSACALEQILADDLGVPVILRQFAGKWYPLDKDNTTKLDGEGSESDKLGYGVVVSEEYWSLEFMVRLSLGPLDLVTFRSFLPGGPGLKRIAEICRFFSRDEMAFEVQLIIRKDQVPPARLSGGADEEESQLGWTTWARSRKGDDVTDPMPAFENDVGDVVVSLVT